MFIEYTASVLQRGMGILECIMQFVNNAPLCVTSMMPFVIFVVDFLFGCTILTGTEESTGLLGPSGNNQVDGLAKYLFFSSNKH